MTTDERWCDLNTRQVQLVLVGMLEWFDRLCERHGIPYWVDAGTLLGAFRHGGFIPWDDDIDVAMRREDYDRFLTVVDGELEGGLRHERRPVNVVAVNSKITLDGTRAQDVYGAAHGFKDDSLRFSLDVFVHDNARDWKFTRQVESLLAFAVGVRPWALQLANSPASLPRLKRLRWKAISLVPERTATAVQDRLVANSRQRRTSWSSCAFDTPYALKTYPKKSILPLSRISFEGLSVPAPHAPQDYLLHHFGPDFMTPPPSSERRVHLRHPQAIPEVLATWGRSG